MHKARGAVLPDSFWTDPLMYQGGPDGFLGPRNRILAADEAWGIDFEAEVAVITDAVPAGIGADEAGAHIKLVMLANDVSLRALIAAELAKGFGFFTVSRRAPSRRWRLPPMNWARHGTAPSFTGRSSVTSTASCLAGPTRGPT